MYGGTIPARIWKDIMTVATRDYGAKDFDYPVIELSNYSASFTKAKVIGDDENPKNEGKAVENTEGSKNVEAPATPEIPQKLLMLQKRLHQMLQNNQNLKLHLFLKQNLLEQKRLLYLWQYQKV